MEEKARQTRLSQIKQSRAVVATMTATAEATIVEAVPVPEPTVDAVQVEEPAPQTDPTPIPQPVSTQMIPPPPDSGVRLVQRPTDREFTAEEIAEHIEQIDHDRLFDKVLRALYGVYLVRTDLEQMMYYVTLEEFLVRCTWGRIAFQKASIVNGVALWGSGTRRPTAIGEGVWQRFRLRIRRESALVRITEGLSYNAHQFNRAA